MGFGETVNQCKDYLRKDESYYYVVGDTREQIEKSLSKMEKDVGKAQDDSSDEQPNITKDDIREVNRSLIFLNEKVVLENLDNNFRIFMHNFVLLASNWNKLAGSKEVARKIDVNQKLIEYHKSMITTAEVLKNLIDEAKKLKHFSPPAFELSKHYLLSLEEKFNSKDKSYVEE